MKGLKQTEQDYSHLSHRRIAIVTADWNEQITYPLRDGALRILKSQGWADEQIELAAVPGTFELATGAAWMCRRPDVAAVICLGCVIQGETRHFEFICQSVAQGLIDLGIKKEMPIIFGVLTTDTYTQAEERAGGSHGHKGEEAAWTAIRMLALEDELKQRKSRDRIGF